MLPLVCVCNELEQRRGVTVYPIVKGMFEREKKNKPKERNDKS